jgi:DNA-directed RNA polymerase specialized sigma24 family protein
MIPAREDSIFISAVREKGIESVVDWFDQHKQSFYRLGWFYLHHQQQMEELFYRSILRVHQEFPRYKRDTPIHIWVTTIFIHTCRELSHESDRQTPVENDLFIALDQLEDDEKEAVLLIYVKEFTQEEAAQVLRVSMDKMKTLLFSGIQSVRKQLSGLTYHGCMEYHKNYLDYLERSMDRPDKIEFEKHIYHCRECQADLATFQDTTLTIMEHAKGISELPELPHFMEKVKKRLIEKKTIRQRKDKKRLRLALVLASAVAFIIGTGFFTGAFTYAYYGWTEDDEQLRAFLQQDLGQRVNLEAESDGVKIKITGVIADDIQTLVFYKIEDTEEDNQYLMSYEEGLTVVNENEVMNQETHPRYYLPDLKAEMNKKEKNAFYGKIGLRPLKKDNGTITLKITKLVKLIQDSSDSLGFNYRSMEYKTGEWSFEVPVSKQPSVEYALNEQTEIEGIPVRFKKLTIAPTATILEYGVHIGQPEKRIDYLQLDDLLVNEKKVKADQYGSGFANSYQDTDWTSFQTQFDSLYGEKPKEVTVQFLTAFLTFEENKSFEIDMTKEYPQTFEYAGSTISIDKIEVGQSTTVVISDREINNRAYEGFQPNIVSENENEPISMEMHSEGVFVDRNGVEYDPNKDQVDFEKLGHLRHFVTEQTIRLDGKIIPKRLDISGYNTTKYLDDSVKIKLE